MSRSAKNRKAAAAARQKRHVEKEARRKAHAEKREAAATDKASFTAAHQSKQANMRAKADRAKSEAASMYKEGGKVDKYFIGGLLIAKHLKKQMKKKKASKAKAAEAKVQAKTAKAGGTKETTTESTPQAKRRSPEKGAPPPKSKSLLKESGKYEKGGRVLANGGKEEEGNPYGWPSSRKGGQK